MLNRLRIGELNQHVKQAKNRRYITNKRTYILKLGKNLTIVICCHCVEIYLFVYNL